MERLRKISVVTVVMALALVMALLVGACSSGGEPVTTATAAPMKLTVGSGFAPPPNASSVAVIAWGNRVTDLTGGKLTFEYLWGGAVVKQGEEADAVKSGLVDVTSLQPALKPESFPLNNFEYACPFTITDPTLAGQLGMQLLNEIPAMKAEFEQYGKLVATAAGPGSYQIQSKSPISTIQDLNGKKVGVVGVMGSWFIPIGAVGITSSAVARYQDLQTGLIDASVMLTGVSVKLHYYEVAPYFINANLGSPGISGGTDILVNYNVWNNLPKEYQDAMLKAGAEDYPGYAVQSFIKDDAAGYAYMQANNINIYDMPQSELTKWADAMPNIPANWVQDMAKIGKGDAAKQIMLRWLELTEQAGWKYPRDWAAGIQ